MQLTLEISLYPLHEQYSETVLEFISELKKYPEIVVETNGLSTQIFGDYDLIMRKIISDEVKKVLENNKAVFVMKLGQGILKYTN